MKKYRLKKWVVASIYVLSIGAIVLSLALVSNFLREDPKAEDGLTTYVAREVVEKPQKQEPVKVVEQPTNETVNHPYLNENVRLSKDFYDSSKSEEEQINSLIYYHNTYMQNTGVLYTSDIVFDVVSVLDGTVTSVTKDEILGNVVEIMHTNDLVTIYHCLDEVLVKPNDKVKQNDVIGRSGKVNIDKGYESALLFEVNYKGEIINPIEFYNMKISDLLNR